jgi:hypothetical protein
MGEDKKIQNRVFPIVWMKKLFFGFVRVAMSGGDNLNNITWN